VHSWIAGHKRSRIIKKRCQKSSGFFDAFESQESKLKDTSEDHQESCSKIENTSNIGEVKR